MNLEIIPTRNFLKSSKKLSKKYKKILDDLDDFYNNIIQNLIVPIDLGNNCFKIRLANSSIPTGKSGGFRVIYFQKIENKIYLLDIYSKKDKENIADERILQILEDNNLIDE